MSKIRQEKRDFGSKPDFSIKSPMTLALDLEMWFNVTEHSLDKNTLDVKFLSHIVLKGENTSVESGQGF